MRNIVLAGVLALIMPGAQAGPQSASQQAIPDAPKPQTTLPNLGSVTPGQGTTSSSTVDTAPDDSTPPASPAAAQSTAGTQAAGEQGPTDPPPAVEGSSAEMTMRVQVNYVDIPFTVKDSKGQLVAGLEARDVQVYENGLRQHMDVFTREATPLSVALVIDQSMTQDEMTRVNDSLGALPDAFTKYDEVSVSTYNHGPKTVTDFTGAQSARLTQAIERSKGTGRDALMAGSLSGPLAQTTVINDQNFDPNTSANRGHTSMQLNPPKEVHTLNDAILAAATALSRRPREFRRVIYVISDGKEYGSKAKSGEVIKYLLRNKIEVDGTLVGDSSLPVLGFLDRFHLPLMMRDNVLPQYAKATGGNFDSEFRTGQIEKSFARVAGEARYRYTVGYRTHEPLIDGKYRKVEVKVLRPNLLVIAKPGYWPSAMEVSPRPATAAQ